MTIQLLKTIAYFSDGFPKQIEVGTIVEERDGYFCIDDRKWPMKIILDNPEVFKLNPPKQNS